MKMIMFATFIVFVSFLELTVPRYLLAKLGSNHDHSSIAQRTINAGRLDNVLIS